MKYVLLTTLLMLSLLTTRSSLAETCQLKLADLSRFQTDENNLSVVNNAALVNYLTKENKVLFGLAHYEGALKALNDSDIEVKAFIENYDLYSRSQQQALASKVWSYIREYFNPLSSSTRSELLKSNESLDLYHDGRTPLFNIDLLSMRDINTIKTLAKRMGLTYHEYLKNYEITQAIDKNPEIKQAVIEILAETIKRTARIATNFEKNLNAKDRMGDLNGGWYNHDRQYADTAGPLNVITTIGGVITGIATSINYPEHLAITIPGSLAIAGLPPLIYSSIRGTQIAYNTAKIKIRETLEKRKLKKFAKKKDQSKPQEPESEE